MNTHGSIPGILNYHSIKTHRQQQDFLPTIRYTHHLQNEYSPPSSCVLFTRLWILNDHSHEYPSTTSGKPSFSDIFVPKVACCCVRFLVLHNSKMGSWLSLHNFLHFSEEAESYFFTLFWKGRKLFTFLIGIFFKRNMYH